MVPLSIITDAESCEAAGCTPICGYVLAEYGTTSHCIERRRASKCVAVVPYDWDQQNNQEMFGFVGANKAAWVRNYITNNADYTIAWHEYFYVDNTLNDSAVVVLGYDQFFVPMEQDPCGDPDATAFPWQGTCDTWWTEEMWDDVIPQE